MKQRTCELAAYAAISKYVELVNIPRVGAKYIRGGLVRTKVACDFVGAIRQGNGRLFICDAKKTEETDRLNLRSAFKEREHQREELIRLGLTGAVSGLFIESTALGRYLWLHWSQIQMSVISIPFRWDGYIDLGPTSHVPDLAKVITFQQ